MPLLDSTRRKKPEKIRKSRKEDIEKKRKLGKKKRKKEKEFIERKQQEEQEKNYRKEENRAGQREKAERKSKEEIDYSQVSEDLSNVQILKTFTSPSTNIEFVLIPAGEFLMGSDENKKEKPIHRVNIKKPFYLSKYPVTQSQWDKIMGSSVWYKVITGTNPSQFKGKDRPVENILWGEVQKFIQKLNEIESTDKYWLPSEAEWEYACRAGTQTKYFFGDDESKLSEYAWYSRNSGGKTHPVGQKKPNPWGLYDMHGNIWEWVQDRYHSNYEGAPSDGSVWEDGDSPNRVIRGGSWDDDAGLCRSADRIWVVPGARYFSVGFRLLRKL